MNSKIIFLRRMLGVGIFGAALFLTMTVTADAQSRNNPYYGQQNRGDTNRRADKHHRKDEKRAIKHHQSDEREYYGNSRDLRRHQKQERRQVKKHQRNERRNRYDNRRNNDDDHDDDYR